jgi:endo-1,3(4)-beta-glucanase
MGFAPWSPTHTGVTSLPAGAMSLVSDTVINELSQDILSQTNTNSVYFSGKALAKFASIIYTANDLVKNPGIAAAGLLKLKQSFQLWIDNQAVSTLMYDTVWKGVVTKAVLGDVNADFGAGAYVSTLKDVVKWESVLTIIQNDHHFHYGYIVYAAAVIAYLDPDWLNQGTNKAWVNSLVRDFANPVDDNEFPFSRSFDWYHGHSWAKGLFVSSDGKGTCVKSDVMTLN